MLGFVIDEVMKDPAQVMFSFFSVSLKHDDAFEIFVVVSEEQAASLIANVL